MVGLPPAWVDDSEEITVNIQHIRRKMAELVKAHSKALMPSFADGKEDQHTIEALTQEITNLLKTSEKRLKKISSTGSSEDFNIRKNVQVCSDSLNFMLNTLNDPTLELSRCCLLVRFLYVFNCCS